MKNDLKRHLTFALRLPNSMRDSAGHLAEEDGISLNHFISLAVAEKISRLENTALMEHAIEDKRPRLTLAPRIKTV